MSYDKLLQHYQTELDFIRKNGVEFAKTHPKLARHLDTDFYHSTDPHMARLVEAIAFANARIHHKLAEDFFVTNDTLRHTLDPEALAPIPAMAIVQFNAAADMASMQTIPADTTLISTALHDCVCQFKTRYPVQLLPMTVVNATLTKSTVNDFPDYTSMLRLSLACNQDDARLSDFGLNQLRFFIHAPLQYAYTLYSLLFNHTTGIAIANAIDDPNPVKLNIKQCLQMVGFHSSDNMLPFNPRSFNGYHLLREFFIFPEKFLFFDLTYLAEPIAKKFTHQKSNQVLEIYIYFDQFNPILAKNIDASFFALSCTPVVNLFDQQAEPFLLNDTQVEYAVVPDSQYKPRTMEIFSVNQVTTTSLDGTHSATCLPFYALKHSEQASYYHTVRKPAWDNKHSAIQGSDVFLSFTDAHTDQPSAIPRVVNVQLSCTNRDLPAQLPFGSDAPGLTIATTHAAPISMGKVSCLTAMTAVHHPSLHAAGQQRSITYYGLNQLALLHDTDGIENLRGLLKLYAYDQREEHLLAGLININSRLTFIQNVSGNLCHGNEITLWVDETQFSNDSLYLFGNVLNHFFALYTTLNLYVQLIIRNQQREIYRYAARLGEREL